MKIGHKLTSHSTMSTEQIESRVIDFLNVSMCFVQLASQFLQPADQIG